ncbi:MAG: hypothetical protein KC438_15620, partial [Thermomicrobiales bacterium]|nr:hypothetical protein [Thermomicrobiales bacterium]
SRLPGLTILATSRSPLNLAHEHVVAVGALDVATTAQGQEQSDAVELFRQRARAIRPGYDPGPADLRAIEAICIQLGGLPLAIELAAARIRVMSPQALQARLSQPLRVLAAGPHDAPARHRSMRDAIDWSYRLLPAEQRALLRAMGVFSGSVPLDGIEQVAHAAGIATAGDLIELLARLADASMIEPVEREQAEPRFQILATVREFLVEELERDGELVSMQDLHAGWIESLSASLAGRFERPQEHFAFARSRSELSNIRAALGWSLQQGATARAVRIAGNLADFWSFGGQSSEGRRWVERIIPVLERQPLTDRERFQFWVSAGLIAWSQGDAKEATQRYTCALELARSLTDVDQARAHMWLAQSAWYEGDYQQMATHARDAIDIAPEKCVPGAGARTLLGIAEMRLDHLDEAERVLTTAQALHAEIGFTRAAIWTLQLLGDLALLRGD